MSCERYWRDGIVLFERGLDDPHRDDCTDCTREHRSRQELIDALPLIGDGLTGDPDWQAKVWQRIDAERAPAPSRWRWQLAGALAAACAVALWIGLGRGDNEPKVETFHGNVLMRTESAIAGDTLRVTVDEAYDIWIYRGDRLVRQCHARQPSDGCKPIARGMMTEMVLRLPGMYEVIAFKSPPVVLPRGDLDQDRAALESAGIHPYRHELRVR